MSKYCQHCGAEVQDNSVFCEYCGKNLSDTVVEKTEPQRGENAVKPAIIFFRNTCEIVQTVEQTLFSLFLPN